jgi:hypothetical protein
LARGHAALRVRDVEDRLVGQSLEPCAPVRRGVGDPEQVDDARDPDLTGRGLDALRPSPQIKKTGGTGGLRDDTQANAATQFVLVAGHTRTDRGEERRAVRSLATRVDGASAEHERPTLERAGDLADDDEVLRRDG